MFLTAYFRPAGVDDSGVWRGVMDSGKTGLFVATDMAPHIELKVDSPLRASRLKISRKGDDASRFISLRFVQLRTRRDQGQN